MRFLTSMSFCKRTKEIVSNRHQMNLSYINTFELLVRASVWECPMPFSHNKPSIEQIEIWTMRFWHHCYLTKE